MPRLGLWVPWADTDSIGWIRYSLDQRDIPYTYLRDEDIRAGHLHRKIDVLLYGHVDLELAEQIHGLPKEWGPMPFQKTTATPSLGTPAASSADITGGIGWRGLEQIQQFIERGGLMITLGNGSMLPIEAGIVRGIRRDSGGVPRSTQGGGAAAAAAAQDAVTRTPGSHVRVTFLQPHNPIAYGYPASHLCVPSELCAVCDAASLAAHGLLHDLPRRAGRHPARGAASGAARPASRSWSAVRPGGKRNLIGRPAIFDMPVGKGRVVAFNFNPMHRDLNRGDQRMLWNAIINWRALLAESATGAPRAAR